VIQFYQEYDWPIRNPNHQPFDHQRVTTEFLLRNKRAYVFNDLGTGKTLSALWAAEILIEMGAIKKVLVIGPLSTIQGVWAYEIFTNLQRRTYAIAHGTRDDRLKAIKSSADFVIINHDGVKIMLDELIAEKFDIIIVDELTAFKNAMSDRSKAMRKLAAKGKAVWGMTALPTPNGPIEAFGQAKVVNPTNQYLPQYFSQFRDMVTQQVAMGVYVPTPNADLIVHAVLQPAIRYTREECLDLPPVLHQYIDAPMTKEQQGLYDQMKRDLYAEYENGTISAVNAGVKLLKLLQIAAGAVFDDERVICYCDSTNKNQVILDTFEELGYTKLIVVAAFRAVVERLNGIMIEKGIRCKYIHGGIGYRERTTIIDEFQNGDGQMLILQPEAVAHGITLTASSTIIWHSLVASGETYNQMNGRITRAGQDKKQFVKHLISSGAERRLVSILEGKGDFSRAILGLFENHEL
jgi:SNF2 family DNA or RNA helicase